MKQTSLLSKSAHAGTSSMLRNAQRLSSAKQAGAQLASAISEGPDVSPEVVSAFAERVNDALPGRFNIRAHFFSEALCLMEQLPARQRARLLQPR